MILKVENLGKFYNRKKIVKNVSIEINRGEIVGLLGPNGAGKTTTFYMIVGLIKPSHGKIFLGKNEITNNPMHERAKKGIGYLPQESSIFRKLSVENNIKGVLEMTNLSKKEQKIKTEKLIAEFRLNSIRKTRGDLLSGGERRRTEIARCLAINRNFILLDEPFSGIDPISIEEIQIIISNLVKLNIGVLITDHNVQQTLSITDRTYIIFEGRILKTGTTEELTNDEEVKKVYLGSNFFIKK